MSNCKWNNKLESWFDGACPQTDELRNHIAACPQCAAQIETLERIRQGVGIAVRHETIGDAQFDAFMSGIRERVEAPQHRHFGLWAWTSIAAAAVIVAVSTFIMITGGPREAKAQTVVESVSTDLDDASYGNYSSDNGTATVWVNMPQGARDLW